MSEKDRRIKAEYYVIQNRQLREQVKRLELMNGVYLAKIEELENEIFMLQRETLENPMVWK